MRLLDWLIYPFRRQTRQPLAARRPGREEMGQIRTVPLGMEATDMKLVDRVSRQNDALERGFGNRIRNGQPILGRASTHVEALPEDETYAARYHRAFAKKGTPND